MPFVLLWLLWLRLSASPPSCCDAVSEEMLRRRVIEELLVDVDASASVDLRGSRSIHKETVVVLVLLVEVVRLEELLPLELLESKLA